MLLPRGQIGVFLVRSGMATPVPHGIETDSFYKTPAHRTLLLVLHKICRRTPTAELTMGNHYAHAEEFMVRFAKLEFQAHLQTTLRIAHYVTHDEPLGREPPSTARLNADR